MKKSTRYLFLLAILGSSVLSLVDQLIKQYILLRNNVDIPLGSIGKLTYSENTGIAFGIPIPQYFLIIAILILLPVIVYLISKEFNIKNKLVFIALTLIISGGIGNLLDRIFRGFVIDYVSILSYPIFNLADVFITFGVLLLIVFYSKIKKD